MRTTISLTAFALCLMIGLPAAAEAGDPIGICLIDNLVGDTGVPAPIIDGGVPVGFALCIDALTRLDCLTFCGPDGDSPDGGNGGLCEFIAGVTCNQQDIDWDGACDDVVSPIGTVCMLIDGTESGDAKFFCERTFEADWLGADSVCEPGVTVPAMPKVAYAALVLVLLAGALILTGSLRP